jgi:hypothetical protein
MAVTRSQVRKAGVTPAFPIGGGDITFHYQRPTPGYFDEMARALKAVSPEDQTLSIVLAAQLVPLITEWDYNDDDGKMLPITEENLLTLPAEILQQTAKYIIEQENFSDSKNAPTPSGTSS